MRARNIIMAAAFMGLTAAAAIAEDIGGKDAGAGAGSSMKIEYHGAGWIQGGRIEKSSDIYSDGKGQDFNGNWSQNTGGQVTAQADLDGGWEGGLGLGAIQTASRYRGSIDHNNAPFLTWSPYVTEARLTYTVGDAAHPPFQITAGSFHFNYNPDTKDLGLYLLRGMVYPGIVISGFETKDMLPIANVFGLDIRHEFGKYRGDFIVNSEMDINPYFDLSPAYVFRYRVADGLELGGGVNWYRALPLNKERNSPGKGCADTISILGVNPGDHEVCYILDSSIVAAPGGGTTTVVDTVTGSLSGIKAMARFSFDPKLLFNIPGPFGPRDLILYSEAALLGVKDYPKYYDKILRRIPVMVGFNLPTMNMLDELSLEVEYYANRNTTDYEKAIEDISWVPRPKANVDVLDEKTGAVVGTYRTDTRGDDWKWALYASKVVGGHLKFSSQVANDHMRTGGFYLRPTQSETLSQTFDWYWNCKVAYYF
jgi:hypothetical protein